MGDFSIEVELRIYRKLIVLWKPKIIPCTIKKHYRCGIFVEKELHIRKAAQSDFPVGIGSSMRRNSVSRKREISYFRFAPKKIGYQTFLIASQPDFLRKPICQTSSNQLCFYGADGFPFFKNLSDCASWLEARFFLQIFHS